jgi:hypothetical protein
MTTREQLVNQHIREFESRQHHIDELLQQARQHAARLPFLKQDLLDIENRHGSLLCDIDEMRHGRIDVHAIQDIERAGPMGIWFGLIDELETFIERTDH